MRSAVANLYLPPRAFCIMAAGMDEEPTDGDCNVEKELTVSLRGGASLVRCRPVFSPDPKCVLCGSGHSIKVLSIHSGECVRELRAHTDFVTGFKINPVNHLQIYSCSLDHKVIKWDYTDGVLLKKYDLGGPLHAVLPLASQTSTEANFLAVKQVTNDRFDLVKFTLPKQATKKVSTKEVVAKVSSDERCISLGCKGDYVACVQGGLLSVYSLKKATKIEHHIEKGRQFTCVAAHPTDYCLATGCDDGKILLWWSFIGSKKVIKTVYHWHALPVADLVFTAEGSYMLSGGHECVLVKWQYNSHHKDTLPRLGAPINRLACSSDNTLYATCHDDNAVQVISSQFSVVQVYQGLTRAHLSQQINQLEPSGLQLDPRSKALVMNGRPGHLQFYSLHNDKQLYNLDIVGQNYISPENLQCPLVITEVENAAFDDTGTWLATVERRDDKETSVEIKLKFWLFNKKSQSYVQNTIVNMPHTSKVNKLVFRPLGVETSNEPMVATSSEDGQFKLWTVIDDTDIYRSSSCWNCESVGFYRDQPAGDADFSLDGSLLAVAFGSTLTLWNPDNNALRTSLSQGNSKHCIRHVLFGRGSCSHLLACTTADQLTIWNLLSCTVHWTVFIPVTVLVRDPSSHFMAAFTDNLELFVFQPNDSEPVYTHRRVSTTAIVSAIFVPHATRGQSSLDNQSWEEKSQLYFLNRNQEFLTLTSEENERSQQTLLPMTQNLPETPFSQLIARQTKSGVPSMEPTMLEGRVGQPGEQFVKEMLSTPAHVLPSTTSLCMTFLKSLLISKDFEKKDNADEDSDSDQVAPIGNKSDSESDMETDAALQNSNIEHKDTALSQEHVETRTKDFSKLSLNMFKWIEKS